MSTKTTYAIRALIDLAKNAHDHPTRLAGVADRQNIPLPYLEQIFAKLKNARLVKSLKGPQGGYQLSQKPSDISLADIVTILEGPLEPVLCSMPENRHDECHTSAGCASRLVCNELDSALLKTLARNTIGSLSSESQKLSGEFLPGSYV